MTEPVQIGDATLYLGDCLEILPELEAGIVDLVFMDPPYGHNNNDGDLISQWETVLGGAAVPESEWRPIANDGPEANEIFRSALQFLDRAMAKSSSCCCCCGGGGPDPQFARWSLWMDEVFDFKQMIVWDKGPIGMGWHYRRSYETILVADKKKAKAKWHSKRRDIENIIRPGSFGIRKIIPSADQHPTEKPVELSAHFIELHSVEGETIIDPFMGSGTTGVACGRMGRKFIGIEIEPEYFDIACKRIDAAYAQGRLF